MVTTRPPKTIVKATALSRPLSRCHLQRLPRFIHSGWLSGRGKLDSTSAGPVAVRSFLHYDLRGIGVAVKQCLVPGPPGRVARSSEKELPSEGVEMK